MELLCSLLEIFNYLVNNILIILIIQFTEVLSVETFHNVICNTHKHTVTWKS
jgi:hypothetical protein